MRCLNAVLVVVCLLVGGTSIASADELGQVPGDALAAVGLAGMQTMSDAEGTEVRGQAAQAFGNSSSSIFVFLPFVPKIAANTGPYNDVNPNVAAGGSFAFAGSVISPFTYAGAGSIAFGF